MASDVAAAAALFAAAVLLEAALVSEVFAAAALFAAADLLAAAAFSDAFAAAALAAAASASPSICSTSTAACSTSPATACCACCACCALCAAASCASSARDASAALCAAAFSALSRSPCICSSVFSNTFFGGTAVPSTLGANSRPFDCSLMISSPVEDLATNCTSNCPAYAVKSASTGQVIIICPSLSGSTETLSCLFMSVI